MQCRHIRHIRPHNWNILTFTLSRYDLSEGRTGRQTHAERSPKQYPLVSSNPEGGGVTLVDFHGSGAGRRGTPPRQSSFTAPRCSSTQSTGFELVVTCSNPPPHSQLGSRSIVATTHSQNRD